MAKRPTLDQKMLVELIGTFLFVFIGAGSAIALQFIAPSVSSGEALIVGALANGIALALAISFAMHISGGHMNPAVTVGAWVSKMIGSVEAIMYIIAQLLGAILGGIALILLFPPTSGVAAHYGAPSLSSSITVTQGIGIEAVMTFFLVFVVFGAVVDRRAAKLGGLPVGLSVVAGVLAGGALTGAAMNPARAMGPMIVSGYNAYWYVYWIGPIIGGVLAALVYNYLLKK